VGAVAGRGAVLRSVCLGCWRRCLVSSLAVIVAAGGPHAVGVLYLFGSLPQLHSRVSGVPGQVFAALTRRELVWSCDSTTKRAFPVSKKSQKISKNLKKSQKIKKGALQ